MLKLVSLLFVAFLTADCGAQPLTDVHPTSEALAREVLTALQARDQNRLEALAVNESEFQARVWKGLPAARPERNVPWDYVWQELQQKSRDMLRRTLSEHGGQRYQLEAVRFTGSSTNHGDYRVHRGSVLVVRGVSGEAMELRLLGSMIDARDGWKVFSYVVDR
jgi:hypothetical protein